MNDVQVNLDVPNDQMIDPEKIIQESGSNPSSFMTKLLGAEAAAIIGSMTAATVLMLGGSKRKKTKRRYFKGNKLTKRSKR
jgi:hypothetical protein